MKVITDPKQAGERLLTFAREGRLAQGTWHAETGGREVACLLGAAAGIDDAKECPASLMPKWLAHALPALWDGQTKVHAMSFARRWGEAMIRPEWVRINWDTVRGEWMAFLLQQAQDAAERAAAYARTATYAADRAILHADACAAAVRTISFSPVHPVANEAARAAAIYGAINWDGDEDYAVTYNAAEAAARDAQADALMDAIERAMEVA